MDGEIYEDVQDKETPVYYNVVAELRISDNSLVHDEHEKLQSFEK